MSKRISTSVKCICARCKKEFYKYPSLVARGDGKYCSRQCQLSKTDADKFWEKVDKSGDCWVWTGGKMLGGYGVFAPTGQPHIGAHRFSWILANGPIPDGMHVLHRCDNPPCVRPEHLFLGTPADNIHDAVAKFRISRGENHPRAKLTEEQVMAVLNSHESHTTLAKRFSVSIGTIRFIRIGRNWKHLQKPAAPNGAAGAVSV